MPKSCDIMMFVCDQVAKSFEILMVIYLQKDAVIPNVVIPISSIVPVLIG